MKLIDVKLNERVVIGDSIVVCVTKILSDHGRAKRVFIGVDAPRALQVMRADADGKLSIAKEE